MNTNTIPSEIIHFNGQLYTKDEQEWFSGYRKIPIQTASPTFQWRGPRMSLTEWRKAMCFMLRVNKLTHSEAQLRAFVVNGEIICWAFPQKKNSGMTTKEISGPEKDAQINEIINRGGVQIMTIHSHCNASAFQSGTDKADESTVDGLHITVGKLSDSEYDLHSRIYYDQCEYQSGSLHSWFDIGMTADMQREMEHLFGSQQSALTRMALCAGISEAEYMAADAFPQQWWDNLIPDAVQQWAGGGGFPRSGVVTTFPCRIADYAGMQRCRRIPGRGLNATERISIMSIAADVFGSYQLVTMQRMLETLKRKNGPAADDVFKDDFKTFLSRLAAWDYSRQDAIIALTQSINPEQARMVITPASTRRREMEAQADLANVDEMDADRYWQTYMAENPGS